MKRSRMGLVNRPQIPLEQRFWRHVEIGAEDGCWPWTGAKGAKGYGRLGVLDSDLHAHTVAAHRTAYELKVGPIPDGLWVLHRCDNPPCCNPRHLFLGTHVDNMRDMVAKGRSGGGARPPLLGEAHPLAQLTDSDIREMRKRRAEGELLAALAAAYGVTKGHVHNITTRRRWRHI